MNIELKDDIDTFMNDFSFLKHDFTLSGYVLDYIRTNKGLQDLPDSIRNMNDAFDFLRSHNRNVIQINRLLLKIKKEVHISLPVLWKYLILDGVAHTNTNFSHLKEKRYLKLFGIDQRIDIYEYI